MAALPTMRSELGQRAAELEWAITAYLTVSAAWIIPGGKPCAAPRRFVSIFGLALFAVASAAIGSAQQPAALLPAGRCRAWWRRSPCRQHWRLSAGPVPRNAAPRRSALGRLPDAGLQSWAAHRRRSHALHRLAPIFWASGVIMLAAACGFAITRSVAASSARPAGRFDWAGFVLLAIFMGALISALQALPAVMRAPLQLRRSRGALPRWRWWRLLATERRINDPLIELKQNTGAAFVRAVGAGSIAMSSILALLLFYNLDAQSAASLGLSPVGGERGVPACRCCH